MTKKVKKILFGTLAVGAIAVVTPLSVVSCSSVPGNPPPTPEILATVNNEPVNNSVTTMTANAKYVLTAYNLPENQVAKWSYNASITSTPKWEAITTKETSISYSNQNITIKLTDNRLQVTVPTTGTIPEFQAVFEKTVTVNNQQQTQSVTLTANTKPLKIIPAISIAVTDNGNAISGNKIAFSKTKAIKLVYTISDPNFQSLSSKDAAIAFSYTSPNNNTKNPLIAAAPIVSGPQTLPGLNKPVTIAVASNVLTITIPVGCTGVVPAISAQVAPVNTKSGILTQYTQVNSITIQSEVSQAFVI